jgi:hypothetical protein
VQESQEVKAAPRGPRCARLRSCPSNPSREGTTPARVGDFARVPFALADACALAAFSWADRALVDTIAAYVFGVFGPEFREGLPTSYRELSAILSWGLPLTRARVERLIWRRIIVRRLAPEDGRGQRAYRYAIGHPSEWLDVEGVPLELETSLPRVEDGAWSYPQGDPAAIVCYSGRSTPVLNVSTLSPEPVDNSGVHGRLHPSPNSSKGSKGPTISAELEKAANAHTRASNKGSENNDPRSFVAAASTKPNPVDGLWIEGHAKDSAGLLSAIAEYLDPLVPGWVRSWVCPLDVPAAIVLDVQDRIERASRNRKRWPRDTIRAAISRAAFLAPAREADRLELARVAEEARRLEREARMRATCRHAAALLERIGAALELREHVRVEVTPEEWRAIEESRETLAALYPALERGDGAELELAEAACFAVEHVDRLDAIEAELSAGEPLESGAAQRMIPPAIGPSNVAAQGEDRGPSADPGNIPLSGPLPCGKGCEGCPQAMPTHAWIEPGPEGRPLDHLGDTPITHPLPDASPLVDPREKGIGLVGPLDPGEDGAHGAGIEALPGEDRDDRADPLLIRFRGPDRNLDPFLDARDAPHVEGGEFGSAESAGHPEEDQRPIPAPGHGRGAGGDHGAEFGETEWARLLADTVSRLRAGRPAKGGTNDRGLDG